MSEPKKTRKKKEKPALPLGADFVVVHDSGRVEWLGRITRGGWPYTSRRGGVPHALLIPESDLHFREMVRDELKVRAMADALVPEAPPTVVLPPQKRPDEPAGFLYAFEVGTLTVTYPDGKVYPGSKVYFGLEMCEPRQYAVWARKCDPSYTGPSERAWKMAYKLGKYREYWVKRMKRKALANLEHWERTTTVE